MPSEIEDSETSVSCMRVQLQWSKAGKTETYKTKVVNASPDVGVTVRQLQGALKILWDSIYEDNHTRFQKNRYRSHFGHAITTISNRLNGRPPVGVMQEPFNIEREEWTDDRGGYFRVDVENLRGHNLRFFQSADEYIPRR